MLSNQTPRIRLTTRGRRRRRKEDETSAANGERGSGVTYEGDYARAGERTRGWDGMGCDGNGMRGEGKETRGDEERRTNKEKPGEPNSL